MNSTPKSRELVTKLQAQLRRSDWYELLSVFLVSGDFAHIVETLVGLVDDELRFTPPIRQLLTPFTACPYPQLRAVIVARGPYTQLGIADGLALSATQPGVCPDELSRVLDAVQQQFKQSLPGSPSLHRWASQGVLLLNQSLTTQLDRDARHGELWNPFVRYLLDRLATSRPELPWIFYGESTWELSDALPENAYWLAPSPRALASACHQLNAHLLDAGGSPILW